MSSEEPLTRAERPRHEPDALLTDYRLRQRDYLLRIARAMSAQRDLREVLTLVIRSAVAMTNGQAGAILLRRPAGGHDLVASYRLEERLEHFLEPLLGPDAKGRSDSQGNAGGQGHHDRAGVDDLDVLRRDSPLTSETGETADQGTELAAPSDRLHVLRLPLRTPHEELGAIVVLRSEGAAVFTPLDTDLLRAFADQAAVAIENAFLHERLAARERQLAEVIERTPGGILLADATGRITSANPAACAIAGCSSDELVGRNLSEALALVDEAGARVRVELPTGSATTSTRGFLRRADGDRGAFVQIDVRALTGAGDEIETFVVDLSDLSTFKAAEDAKSAFLAGLSHELKTPLALIQGYAETLKVEEVRQDVALCDEALDVILDETGHLDQMVEQLLLAARVQAGMLTLDLDVVDVAGLVRRLVSEFGHAYPERTWLLELDDDLPPITADPVRLREVLQNLLSNACRYSDADSPVTVRAITSDGGVRIEVSDTGIGIPPEDQERIFERFVRLSNRGEGTGLGLYMSRAIVEAHGGTITVESTPGEGSTFSVTLPAEPPGRQAVSEAPQDRKGREA